MSDNSGIFIAFALIAIAFYGEPDLVDAIIYHFTGVEDGWKEGGEQ